MRLVLVLPMHRMWRWHLDLIQHLRARGAEIAIVLDQGAPAYGSALLTWLKLEKLRTGPWSLAEPCAPDPSWPDIATCGTLGDAIFVNLAERDLGRSCGLELRFDGSLSTDTLIETLLKRQQPVLEVRSVASEAVLAGSCPATEDKHFLAHGLENCFSRSVALILRALFGPYSDTGQPDPTGRSTVEGDPASPRLGPGEAVSSEPIEQDPPARAATGPATHLTAFILRSLAGQSVEIALRPIRHPDHWTSALRLAGGPFRPIEDDGERYFADPFLVQWDDRRFVFLEEFVHATRRGHISAAEIRGDRLLAPPEPALRCAYHLSYPHVFRAEGSLFMIPESGANRSVDLYRADAGPWSWRKVATLLEGRVFVDATPVHHRGLWWLFVGADDHGTATQDELQLYYSEHLAGPYQPHPSNPIQSDCRFARPAGRIRIQGERMLRPAQDCEANYGAGIAWFEIEELTPTTYRERLLEVWNGPRDFGVRGLHSFDQLGDLQALDVNGPRLRGFLRGRRPAFRRWPIGLDARFLEDGAG